MRKQLADGVYTRKDRKGYFISWVDAQGRRKRRKTNAHTLQQARAALAAEKLKVEQARMLGFPPPSKDTFAEVSEAYLKHQRPRLSPGAFERTRGAVEGQFKCFFDGKIAAVRKPDVERYVTKRMNDGLAPDSVRRELFILKHLFSFAVEREIIPFNPAQSVKPPKESPGRVRYLQPTELRALLEACPVWLQPIVTLAVATGMRRGEILGLRLIDIDLANSTLWLKQTKNGDGRMVPLNSLAKAAIDSIALQGASSEAGKLFPTYITADSVSVAFHRACRKAAIEDFRFHDLRHTAASWLRMSGADIHTVALVLGHKSLRMAARYQHLSPAFLSEAVGRLDDVFGDSRPHGVTAQRLIAEGEAVIH